MSKKETLNIYEVLEILNDKINSNNTQIETNNNQLKFQLDGIKTYLLEKIDQKAKENMDFLVSELQKEISDKIKHIQHI